MGSITMMVIIPSLTGLECGHLIVVCDPWMERVNISAMRQRVFTMMTEGGMNQWSSWRAIIISRIDHGWWW